MVNPRRTEFKMVLFPTVYPYWDQQGLVHCHCEQNAKIAEYEGSNLLTWCFETNGPVTLDAVFLIHI